jgi:uncharacterized membrane protein HdeD (DUF308 family)
MSDTRQYTNPDENRRKRRKRREAALLLLIFGLALLSTPIVNTFTITDGEPSIYRMLIYIFGVWAVLIVMTAILSGRMDYGSKDT